MKHSIDTYDFVFRGLLTQEALDRTARSDRKLHGYFDQDVAKLLSVDILDGELVRNAKSMAAIYVAVATFENSARKLVQSILAENFGENWWNDKVSEKIRQRAESRQEEEAKVKWHTQRGQDLLNYTEIGDLVTIMRNNWEKFEPHVRSLEWAAAIFTVVERSRNVIMHSGKLDKEDIERLGMNIRDWVKQVGT